MTISQAFKISISFLLTIYTVYDHSFDIRTEMNRCTVVPFIYLVECLGQNIKQPRIFLKR